MLALKPVGPIGAHELLLFLLQVALLLGTAFLLSRVAGRFGLPAVVGELLTGVLLGPSLLGHLAPAVSAWLLPSQPEQVHLLDALGQLGVLLLVGFTGMHVDVPRVVKAGRNAVLVGASGLLLPLGLGLGVGLVVPASLVGAGTHRWLFALFLGVALCLSAVPVIAKILLDMRLLHRDFGQLILAVAAVDDITGWMLLSVVSALAVTGPHGGGELLLPVAKLVAVIAFTLLVGRPVVRVALSWSQQARKPEVSVVTVVLLLLLASAGTQALGLEPILGAFLGGVLMGSSGLLDQQTLVPLRVLVMAVLAPVFFATAGLRMDVTALGSPLVIGTAALILLAAVLGKVGGAYVGARAGRLSHWEALSLGAGLNARGVVGIAVATVGLRLGVLTTAVYTIVVLVAVVTSVMAPAFLRFSAARIHVTPEEHELERVLEPH